MWLAETGGAVPAFFAGRARSFARYGDSLLRAIVLPEISGDGPACRLVCGTIAAANRAELLSKRLAKRLKLPPEGVVLLVRRRPWPDKHLLTSRQRRESDRGAFATHPGSQVDN
jgi:hypothetical protein